jgi:hypothetical protein
MLPVLPGSVCNTRSLYCMKPNPRTRRKMAASNAIALKSDRKLLALAMEDAEGLSCRETSNV